MRESRFTEEQMIAALKEHAAGTPAKDRRRLGWGWERAAYSYAISASTL